MQTFLSVTASGTYIYHWDLKGLSVIVEWKIFSVLTTPVFFFSANCEAPDSKRYTWTKTCPSNIGYKMDIFYIRTVQFEQSTRSVQGWVLSSQCWSTWSMYFTQQTQKVSSYPKDKPMLLLQKQSVYSVCGYNHCLF
jgi:hypothetical protein